ncbi:MULTISPECIES: murein biosynthesis integral membrane protein MurJ [unclassified Wenzhouxiangella]|uniref:murein biosynthesis integral membrane protein MurJ n=1 Tax=unclassified Wenzhouxiangella TaxID=2613841 RepID=UPI000E3265B6|nr:MULTISPECIES: murein biosynthesis integral membrane protein MurJ [unclassified Wenzhouxiangella]RFF27813.1 murein biosynthesis integral membrane protein MurJ [Wenzhouxiangella sp. 15181]RFP70344.1 murein biosynthesis integral membrane protein MurJ [Wenzhouxiangella sp. 15190]
MSLLRSVFSFGSMTLISRILGFVRDVVFARWFGAGPAMDAFVFAFKIPNFLRRLFAEGSFSLAFVPVLNEYREKHDHAQLKSLIDATAGSLLAVLLVVTALGMFASGWVVTLFAPGFINDPETFALAADMLRVTFPYLLFIALTALAGGILNTLGRFALPALTPALLNISLITAAVVVSPMFEQPVKALAWGVLIAGVLQLLVQLPILARHDVLPLPKPGFGHAGVKRIMKLMVPTLFGSSVAQVSLLFDVFFASLLTSGSLAWLYYGDRLMEFPLGMFGVALSVVILPTLSSLHARDGREEYRATLDWAMTLGLVIAMPAAVGLAIVAEPLVITLFHYGAFSDRDAAMAAAALLAYTLGLPAFIGVKILAPAYFSRQDTKTPVKVAIIAFAANMVLNVLFAVSIALWLAGGSYENGFLAMLSDHPGAHAGLALASSVSGWINASLLWRGLRHESLTPRLPWLRVGQVAAGCLAMALVLYLLQPDSVHWLEAGTAWRIGMITLVIGGGTATYALVLLAAGLRPHHVARPHKVQSSDS